MHTYKHFIGVDIGKETLAVCVIDGAENRLLECSATNSKAGMKTLLTKLEKLSDFSLQTALICMEHTGIYCQPMVSFFYPPGMALWLQSAVQIKQSLGVKRGKTDKADARSIATYSLRHQKDLRLFCLTDSVLSKVRQLASQRERLMEMAKQLTDIAQDYKAMGLLAEWQLHQQTSESVLLALKSQIAQVDKQIDTEIKADADLQTRVELLTSIPGVGRQTALYMLIFTANFTRFDDAKKLASYAGVAPFAYESGTSIRGRTQVSPMANKKLKHLLHMAALGAVRVEGDLKAYFERKVGAGKRKMSVLNAIRNKIVHRIMAVMERGTPYSEVYVKLG